MNNLTKWFLFSFVAMFLTLTMTIITTTKQTSEDLKTFNKIAKLQNISLSTYFYELHPTLKEMDYMDFVYGK